MKYNNYNEAYMIIGYFTLDSVHFTRVRFMETGEEEVFLTKTVKTGEFYSNNYKAKLKAEKKVVEEPVETVEQLDESYKIQATSPRGKIHTINSDDLESFAKTYKLEIEAIKSCVKGEQKTHRRWGFVKID